MSQLTKNETGTLPIAITEGALSALQQIRAEEKVPEDYALRVGVKGGGCSGFSYQLGFDAVKDGDQSFDIEGMKVVMSRAHGIYLVGMEIDYVDGLDNRGFIFNNPNATETCGCGTSFSA